MIRKRILIISLMVTVFAFMPVNVGATTEAFLDEFPPYGDKWTLETGNQSIATAKITSGELQIWTLADIVGLTQPTATAKLYKDVWVWKETDIIIYYSYSAKGFIKAEGMALAGVSLEIYVEDSSGNRMRTVPLVNEDAEFNEYIPIDKSEAWYVDPLSIPSAGAYRIGVCLAGYSVVQGVGVGLCDFLVEEGNGVQVSMTIYVTGTIQHPEYDELTELMVGDPLTPYYTIEVPGWGYWWDYWNILQSQVFINNADAVTGSLCVGTQVRYQTTPPPPHYLIFQLSTPLDITQWEAFRFYQILGSFSTGYCEFGFIDGSEKYATKTYQLPIGVWMPMVFDYTDLAGWTVEGGFNWNFVWKIIWWASCTQTYDAMLIDFPRFSLEVNSPPNTPSAPSGSTTVFRNVWYTYSTSTTDPDGDDIRYKFEVTGPSTNASFTTGWYASGQTVSIDVQWEPSDPLGAYQIRVRAQDVHGLWSGWSPPLTVTLSIPVDLTVLAEDQYGSSLTMGDVYIDGELVGYTGSTFGVATGNHSVFVCNFWESGYTGNRFGFDYWEDDSTDNPRTIQVLEDTTITAHFFKKWCPGDATGDGYANVWDLGLMSKHWHNDTTSEEWKDMMDEWLAEGKYAEIYVYANEVSCLDFNCDEFINVWDLSILSDNWLKGY